MSLKIYICLFDSISSMVVKMLLRKYKSLWPITPCSIGIKENRILTWTINMFLRRLADNYTLHVPPFLTGIREMQDKTSSGVMENTEKSHT